LFHNGDRGEDRQRAETQEERNTRDREGKDRGEEAERRDGEEVTERRVRGV
jgi:hypothetical protein